MKYLLDTNHASRFLTHPGELDERLESLRIEDIFIPRPAVGELWYMIFNSSRLEQNRLELEALLGRFAVAEFDDQSSVEYGRLRVELRRKGRPIPPIDLQIAAIARSHSMILVSADRHFAAPDGLSVLSWLS